MPCTSSPLYSQAEIEAFFLGGAINVDEMYAMMADLDEVAPLHGPTRNPVQGPMAPLPNGYQRSVGA